MITYPSTHGVYEHEVREICDAVHEAGGQVYVDGANLNALLGYARFGDFGGDVSHLNLHKTFCIPHGGGGPGVGPVAAKAHLAPFLPGHPLAQRDTIDRGGVTDLPSHRNIVSAAPYGSPEHPADLLGVRAHDGHRTGSRMRRAPPCSPPTTSPCACATTTRCSTRATTDWSRTSASSTSVRSRRRPASTTTMSRSASSTTASTRRRCRSRCAGTLMVEPTESEDLAEIDRFIDAMIAIKEEADAVAAGRWPADDNPLVNAPHTAESVIAGEWDARLHARGGGLPAALARAAQVLAAGAPHRPGLRRPQPRVRVPAGGGVRVTGVPSNA